MSCFNSVCVKVERLAKSAGAPPKCLFLRTFQVTPEIHLPYQQILDTLRILFGPDVVITFSSEYVTYNNK